MATSINISMNPFLDHDSFSGFMKEAVADHSLFAFAIIPSSSHSTSTSQTPNTSEEENQEEIPVLEVASLNNPAPQNRCIEIGMLFSPLLQRTTEATECAYLLMKHCFEDLGYLRLEWKCNNANEQSKRAAVRLGFVYEGLFRRHQVVKGRRRDTAWYSVIKEEWGFVGKSLEVWLDEGNFDGGEAEEEVGSGEGGG